VNKITHCKPLVYQHSLIKRLIKTLVKRLARSLINNLVKVLKKSSFALSSIQCGGAPENHFTAISKYEVTGNKRDI